ncbi:hypothetical protein ACFT8P_26100 [Streptomyces sp. NPDC057101]|uniref:hypothetical protein n=1 Tax=Streptomyces sp. NPDC057101 TaxID=3346020 RepID=UPI003638B2EF
MAGPAPQRLERPSAGFGLPGDEFADQAVRRPRLVGRHQVPSLVLDQVPAVAYPSYHRVVIDTDTRLVVVVRGRTS